MSNITDPNGGKTDPNPGGGTEIKFTPEQQAHVDRIVGDARKAGHRTGAGDLLKDLGFEKTDDAKAVIKKAKDLEQAQLSEQERLKAAALDFEKKSGEHERRAIDAEGELAQSRLELSLLREMRKQKLEFVSDVAEQDALEQLVRSVETDDEGRPLKLDEALKALAKDRPYLFGKAVPGVKVPPSIDATNRGKNDGMLIDEKGEAELETRFGIRH